MSKTVKTIAWICLVLGLLGVAVDAVVLVRAQSIRANVAERIASGEMPSTKGQAADKDNDSESNNDENKPGLGRGQKQNFLPGGRRDAASGKISFKRDPGKAGRRGFGFGLPLLFVAAGPILVVVGAVTLIVNREPKKKETEAKKSMKKEKTHKN